MRTRTILFLCASALSQLTYAAPALVAIDLGAVTEEIPKEDAPQLATLHRKQKVSEDKAEDVQLWIDDFGNIEAVPTSKPAQAIDESSTGKTSRLQEAMIADAQAVIEDGAGSRPPLDSTPRMMAEQRRIGTLDTEYMMGSLSAFSGVLYVLAGGLLLSGLVFTLLRLVTRRRNIRIGHRRGHSRYSL